MWFVARIFDRVESRHTIKFLYGYIGLSSMFSRPSWIFQEVPLLRQNPENAMNVWQLPSLLTWLQRHLFLLNLVEVNPLYLAVGLFVTNIMMRLAYFRAKQWNINWYKFQWRKAFECKLEKTNENQRASFSLIIFYPHSWYVIWIIQ